MYGFIEKDSDLKIEDAVYDEVLNAGLGWMHELKKGDRKSTRLNSSHDRQSRMPSSA